MRVEFLADKGWPAKEDVWKTLQRALAEFTINIDVDELTTEEANAKYNRLFPSPTILVDGKDLFGSETTISASAWRISFGRARGVPTATNIKTALLKHLQNEPGINNKGKLLKKRSGRKQDLSDLEALRKIEKFLEEELKEEYE